jgi:hypothetical protein
MNNPVQCTWRAIYVQAVFLLRIVQWGRSCVVAHNGGWPSFWLWFECTHAPLEIFGAKQGQQSEKTNQLHDCNSALRTHLISCRVNYTCSRRAPFQVKECAIANVLVFSRHQPCWNVTGNILARFVWWPFKRSSSSWWIWKIERVSFLEILSNLQHVASVDMLMIVLVYWCVDVLMCWWHCIDDCVDVLMCWWLCWCICWSADLLICWWLCWSVQVLIY